MDRFSPCSTRTIGETTLQLERGRPAAPSMELGMGAAAREASPSLGEAGYRWDFREDGARAERPETGLKPRLWGVPLAVVGTRRLQP